MQLYVFSFRPFCPLLVTIQIHYGYNPYRRDAMLNDSLVNALSKLKTRHPFPSFFLAFTDEVFAMSTV
jgi:hypothetical protein